jgi:Peptidase M50B-like
VLLTTLEVLTLILFAARHLSVIAHEGAHAIFGRSMGRKILGVKLNSDATGETSYLGAEKGLGRIIITFAGYLGPSLFGLGAAALIALGFPGLVLWLALFLLLVMLFLVRNLFGVISVLLNGALLVLFMSYGSTKLQDGAAYVLSWLLLFSGVGHVLKHGSNAADAATLRKITSLPPALWSTLWLVITVAALWAGAHMLT